MKIEIPDFLEHLPLDKHGYPITAVTTIRDGIPDFTAVDEYLVQKVAVKGDNCGICGKGRDYWIFFLGGPRATEGRYYFDPPMHERCARFAATACPYIAVPNMLRRKNVAPDISTPEGFIEERPEVFYLYKTRGFKVLYRRDGIVFRAAPAVQIEALEATRVC